LIRKLVLKTNELKEKAIKKENKISMALLLGGLAACQPLVTKIKEQFNILI